MKRLLLSAVLVFCILALLGIWKKDNIISYMIGGTSFSKADLGKDSKKKIAIKVNTDKIRSDVVIDFELEGMSDKKYLESLGKMINIRIADHVTSFDGPEQSMTAERFREIVDYAARGSIPGGKITAVHLDNFVKL